MTFRKAATSITALCTCLAQTYVHAAHPLATDDTGTQGLGRHQLELSTDRARSRQERVHEASFTYSYGALEDLDVFVTVPVSLRRPEGRGDASLGVKWLLLTQAGNSLALKPELFLPTGREEKGLGTGRGSAALTLIASKEASPWTFHGNLGIAVNRFGLEADRRANKRIIWRTSAAAAFEITPQWSAVGELGVTRSIERTERRYPAFALLGLIYSPNDDLDIDLGFRRGLNASEARHQLGIGIAIRF